MSFFSRENNWNNQLRYIGYGKHMLFGYLQIGEIVTETLQRMGDQAADTLEQVYAADAAARRTAREIMEKL